MKKTHTLVISDIHLGLESCQAGLLLKMLDSFYYEHLIVLGDLYERGRVICEEQFEVVKYLRQNRRRLVYVAGNHDYAAKNTIDPIIGARVVKSHKWQAGQKRFVALHGHQFDKFCFIFSEPAIDRMISRAILFLQRIDSAKLHVAKWIDGLHGSYARHVAKRACRYAKRRKADVVICGHIHRPGRIVFSSKKNGRAVEYFNCGSWVSNPCSFVAVDQAGSAELKSLSCS